MKRKYLILLLIPLFWKSCTIHEPDLFELNPSERLMQTLNNVNAILKGAPNGWIMDYYPGVGDFARGGTRNANPRAWGGYTLFLDFKDNDLVTIRMLFGRPPRDGRDSSATSMYQLIPETGPVLSFNTLNPILHYFTNPRNPDGINDAQGNQGMNGDNEFIIMSASPERIVLRGKKESNTIIMRPFNESISQGKSKADYLATINVQEQDLIFLYSNFLYINGTDTASVERGITTVTSPAGTIPIRVLTFTYPDPTGGIFDIVERRAFVSDLNGIVFYEPLELFGKTITRMDHNLVDEYYTVPGLSGTMTPNVVVRYAELLGTYMMHFSNTGLPPINRNRRLLVTVEPLVPGFSFALRGVLPNALEALGTITMLYDSERGFRWTRQIMFTNEIGDAWTLPLSITNATNTGANHGIWGEITTNEADQMVITMVDNGSWTTVAAGFLMRYFTTGTTTAISPNINIPTRPSLEIPMVTANQERMTYIQFVKQ